MRTRYLLSVQIALLLVSSMAHAEVMDKEPGLAEVWLLALPMALLSFFACRFNPFLALLTLPLPVLYLLSFLAEVTDPWVGPSIIAEAGWAYVAGCGLAFIVVGVAHYLGVRQWRRKTA